MALNRLVESHERVSAPARRKSKGHAPAPKEHAPSLSERLEPVSEKRQARPHRQAPTPVVPPPPVERPAPPMAGYAQLTPPAPPADRRPDRSRNVRTAALSFARPDLSLPRANLEPVVEDLPAVVAPDPASWVTLTPHPSRIEPSLRTEATPRRAPRPVIPRAAAWSGGVLQEAEPIRPDVPPAAGVRRVVPGMARKASAAVFQAAPVLPARGGKPAPTFQDPPVARPACLAPPAAARGESDAKGFFAVGEISHVPVHLPHRVTGPAETGRVLPGRARLETLPMPGVAAREARRIVPTATPRFAPPKPLLPSISKSLETKEISHELALTLPALPKAERGPVKAATAWEDAPPVAAPAKPLAPNVPAPAYVHRVGEGSFRAGTPLLEAGRARSTAQHALGPLSARPQALPRFDSGLTATRSLATVAPLAAIGAPRPRGAKPAPCIIPALSTEPNRLVIAQEGLAFQLTGQERIASVSGIAPASAPRWFSGTTPVPIGTVLALSVRTPGLPALENRLTAARGLEQPGPQLPGLGRGLNIAATPRGVAVAIELEGTRPPAPVSAPVPALVMAQGGILSTAAAAARNLKSRFAAPRAAEFSPEPATFVEQSAPLAARCTLATGSALPAAASHPKPSAPSRLPSDYAGFAPQPADLPAPLHLTGSLRLTGTGYRTLQSASVALPASRQSADWQALGSASAGFDALCSGLPVLRMAPVSSGRFQVEKAPVLSGGRPRPLPPVAVEMQRAAVIDKESANLAAGLGEAPAFRLNVQERPDDRTAVKTVRLAPAFRPVKRPARLPVFGSARRGKASMPEAVFVSPDEHEDIEDFSTMRLAPGYDAIAAQMVMPVSQPVWDFSMKLPSADLLWTEIAPATGTVRAAAFDYRIPLFRPHLPDGWVDTVPVEFDPAAVEAAQEQNWVPLAGAIRNATRFFKFM